MKRIVLFTGNELRHDFFRKYLSLSSEFKVVKSFCECTASGLENLVEKEPERSLRQKHLQMRHQSEIDFFRLFCDTAAEKSNPECISYGDINLPDRVEEVISLAPDLIICYGASIIRSPLIDLFSGRFINIHLGLSPYYRGAGTNFWPFVNNEPEFAGVTFMHIDRGIDTGKIIHQLQAEIHLGDSIHQIGNRLIANMAGECKKLILHFDDLEHSHTIQHSSLEEKNYRKKDFTEASVEVMNRNFQRGMIEKYLVDRKAGKREVPIVRNTGLLKNILVV